MIRSVLARLFGVLVLALPAAAPTFGQVVVTPGVEGPTFYESPVPPAEPFSKRLNAGIDGLVPAITLPFLNNAQFIQDDFANPQPGKRLRIGVEQPIQFDPGAGLMLNLPDGSRLWAIEIVSPSAFGIRLHLTDFDLPEGAEVVAYAPTNLADISGPHTGRGPLGLSEVWISTIFAQRVRIECYLPAAYQGPLPFRVGNPHHIYRNLLTDPEMIVPAEGTCHNDVTCYPAWANTAKAVGMMEFTVSGGTSGCTGQLLATQNNDLTPYFLSANHCVNTAAEASSLTVYWLYQTPTCLGTVPNLASVPRTQAATVVSNGTNSDYALLQLTGLVPTNLFWAGWTNVAATNGAAIACIHHPDLAYKRISFGTKASWLSGDCTLGIGSQTIRAEWALPPVPPTSGTGTLGVTEGGSSGSGIYITSGGNQLLVGTLSCGPSACGVSAASRHDSYGEFADTYLNAAVSTALASGTDDSPGGNNSCATATVLTPTTSGQTTTSRILRKTPTFDDWYKLTIPGGSRLNLSTAFTAVNGNIDVQAFTVCGGAVVANTSGSSSPKSLPSTLTNTSTAPKDYWIRVYLTSGVRNIYTLTYSYTAGVVSTNNICSTPTVIALGTTAGTNVGATNDTNSTCGTTGSPDVWFQYTANFNGTLQIDTCGSVLDTVVSVHSSCPSGGNIFQLACNDNTSGCAQAGRSLVQLSVNLGATYRIRVAGASGATGSFQLTLSQVSTPPPANDNCAAATALPAQGSVPYNTAFATTDGPTETLCNGSGTAQVDFDVWFTYTSPFSGTATFFNCPDSAFDSRIAIYNTSCPAGPNTAIACNDDGCTGLAGPSTVTITTSFNHTYKVRLGGFSGSTGAGNLSVVSVNTCRADVAGLGGSPGAGDGVTADDLVAFLAAFFANNVAVADLTGLGGSGGPDGAITVDDLVLYLSVFFAGCP